MNLKPTGRCHYCRRLIPSGIFCEPPEGSRADSCEVKYTRRNTEIAARRKAKRAEKDGEFTPRGGTIAERIESVLEKAFFARTLYNGYERSRIARKIGVE